MKNYLIFRIFSIKILNIIIPNLLCYSLLITYENEKIPYKTAKPSYIGLAIHLLILFFAFSDNTYVSTFIGLSDVISLIPR